MERKLEKIFRKDDNKVVEFRGLPINVPIDLKDTVGYWVYGSLKIVDDYNNKMTFVEDKKIPRRAYITYYYNQVNNMSLYTEVEVHLDSIGQLVCKDVFEGSILSHPDYPECLFEISWDKYNTRWIPKLIYGTNGVDYSQKQLPLKIQEYSINSLWCKSLPWYTEIIPANKYYNDNYILLETINNHDIWYNSIKGNNGDFLDITTEDKNTIIMSPINSLGELSIIYPELLDKLLKQKLIKLI